MIVLLEITHFIPLVKFAFSLVEKRKSEIKLKEILSMATNGLGRGKAMKAFMASCSSRCVRWALSFSRKLPESITDCRSLLPNGFFCFAGTLLID